MGCLNRQAKATRWPELQEGLGAGTCIKVTWSVDMHAQIHHLASYDGMQRRWRALHTSHIHAGTSTAHIRTYARTYTYWKPRLQLDISKAPSMEIAR